MRKAVVCGVLSMMAATMAGVAQTAPNAAEQAQAAAGVLRPVPYSEAGMDPRMLERIHEALKGYHGPEYVRYEAMVPARDGVLLHVTVVRPKGSETAGPALPFLMNRTPYGIDAYNERVVELSKRKLAESGYIFVFEDIRGRYGSGGKFVMNRPVVAHNSNADVDETTDTRDTIDWLLKNVPNNNGRVGVYGVSYPGFLAMMAGIDAHPAVKAISPQAPMTDTWMGDDFFHNGAFRETYGFDYVQELEAQKTDAVQDSKEDQYNFFLEHVNFAGAAAAAGMTNLPTAQKFLTQPNYTAFWKGMAVERDLGAPEVPTLEVGGVWDQEDMWGTQEEYAVLRAHEKTDDPKHRVFLVLGPWNHGGWSFGPGADLTSHFGGVTFGGQKTGEYYRDEIEAPFFEWYLKDKPGFDLKDTASFRTGENQWHRYSVWPPKDGFKAAKLYLEPGGALSGAETSHPAHGRAMNGAPADVAAMYVADPANPVPYRHRPIQSTYGEGSLWRQWLVEDQSFVTGRKDVAVFETPVLTSDVTVTGDVTADLFAATTGSDADWVVKLIDVYPDGTASPDNEAGPYQLQIADEIFRGRYRNSFETPEAVTPKKVTEYKWSLHAVDHTFLKGHRMMVEVQSTWFPLYDRNPQTWAPNIMTAPASAYKAETVTILGSKEYPSHLDVPVSDATTLP